MTREEAVSKFLVLYVPADQHEKAARTLHIILDMFEIRGELKGAREVASDLVKLANGERVV